MSAEGDWGYVADFDAVIAAIVDEPISATHAGEVYSRRIVTATTADNVITIRWPSPFRAPRIGETIHVSLRALVE